jgi:hypothetical protein
MKNEGLRATPTASQADYTVFSVVRGVERNDSARKFLERVGNIACNVLPRDTYMPANFSVEPADFEEMEEEEELGPAILLQTAVNGTRVKLFDRLELPLLHREVPREMEYASSYMQAAQRLRQQNKQFAQVAQQFDGAIDSTKHEVKFTHLTWSVAPHRRHNELALVPDVTDTAVALWMNQASTCFDIMLQTATSRSTRALKRIARTVFPTDNIMPAVRFARMPDDIEVDEQVRFAEFVQGLLPVYLTLGKISINFEQREQL